MHEIYEGVLVNVDCLAESAERTVPPHACSKFDSLTQPPLSSCALCGFVGWYSVSFFAGAPLFDAAKK